MVGRSPVVASALQRRDLIALSRSRERGEADRARAILLTLGGWTSPWIAEAFGVREDTVRLWRSALPGGLVEALPFRLIHGEIATLGFRFGRIADAPDVSRIREESLPSLEGLDILILDALRYAPHPAHFSWMRLWP